MFARILIRIAFVALASTACAQTLRVVESQNAYTYSVGVGRPVECDGLGAFEYIWEENTGPQYHGAEQVYRCIDTRAETSARLHSDNTGERLTIEGVATARLSAETPVENGSLQCLLDGWREVTLEVTERTPVRVSAAASTAVSGPGHDDLLFLVGSGASVDLPGGPVNLEFSQDNPGEDAAEWSGILEPGLYQVVAGAQAYVSFDVEHRIGILDVSAAGSIVIETRACAGDLNRDFACDVNDLAILLGNFGSGDADRTNGDFNGDGRVDLSDLNRILAAFGLPCQPE